MIIQRLNGWKEWWDEKQNRIEWNKKKCKKLRKTRRKKTKEENINSKKMKMKKWKKKTCWKKSCITNEKEIKLYEQQNRKRKIKNMYLEFRYRIIHLWFRGNMRYEINRCSYLRNK